MSFFGDLIAGQGAAKASKYNAALLDKRDAKIQEQQAEQGCKVFEQYDLPRFDYYAEKQQEALRTSILGSGVEFSGSAYALALEKNQIMIDTDRDMMRYNAEVAKEQQLNNAIMTRAEANVERFRGRVAKRASYFQAAGSLLSDASTVGAFDNGYKIYETQIRPTTEVTAARSTSGMRVSQATGAAIGQAIKGTAKQATKIYAEIETRKSENEVLEKTKELYEGNDNFEGLSMVVEKASMMDDPDEAIKYYNLGLEKAKLNVGSKF